MTSRASAALAATLLGTGVGAALVAATAVAAAQPPVSQMAGIPLPDTQLDDGTITVRVIRGQMTNNVPDLVVELHEGDSVTTAVTDANGRATFTTRTPGASVQAIAELDGERLASQTFAVPSRGGIRLMLVGADPTAPAARTGTVTFGSDSWIQVELVDERIEVYFFLEIVNRGDASALPSPPIVVELPENAQGATVLRSSTPRAIVAGNRLEVAGPFDPGTTPVHFAYILPYSGDRAVIAQPLPVDLEALLVSVEKWGAMDFNSAQVERRREMPADGVTAMPRLLGAGPRIAAGQPWTIELTGLPHRSALPRSVAVGIALAVLGAGAWGAAFPPAGLSPTRVQRAQGERREALFASLVRVERQHRRGKIGAARYKARRQALVRQLEQVYRDREAQVSPGSDS